MRSQAWNIVIQVNLRSIKTKSAAILIGVVAISLLLFLAELWDTPLCGLPNPISDTPAAIMTLIGRIITNTMIWANRERLRTAGWWGGWVAKGLLLGGLTEAAGVFLKAYGEVYLAKRPDEQEYCYKDPDIGGIGNGREMWVVIGPAIIHILTVLGGVVVLKHDRCWMLGPHGLLNGLRDHYHEFNKLTLREVEIIVDSVITGKQISNSEKNDHRDWSLTMCVCVLRGNSVPRFPIARDVVSY